MTLSIPNIQSMSNGMGGGLVSLSSYATNPYLIPNWGNVLVACVLGRSLAALYLQAYQLRNQGATVHTSGIFGVYTKFEGDQLTALNQHKN